MTVATRRSGLVLKLEVMSSCFNCETPVAPEDRFCGNCGIALNSVGGAAASPSSNDADLLDAGSSSLSAAGRQTGGQSARIGEPDETGGESASQTGAGASQDDYSAELQPTIIESAAGGSAAAAARAHEPAPAESEERPVSQNFADGPSASQSLADETPASQSLTDSNASSQNLSDASSSLSDVTADDAAPSGAGSAAFGQGRARSRTRARSRAR